MNELLFLEELLGKLLIRLDVVFWVECVCVGCLLALLQCLYLLSLCVD